MIYFFNMFNVITDSSNGNALDYSESSLTSCFFVCS